MKEFSPVSHREGRKPRGRAAAAQPWGLEMQYLPECFSSGLSSLGDPPCLPACGMPLSSAVGPQARGLQSQIGGWPDATVTKKLAGRQDTGKAAGTSPRGRTLHWGDPKWLPTLKGSRMLSCAGGPRDLWGNGKTHLCSSHWHPSSSQSLESVSLRFSSPLGCGMAVLCRTQELQPPTWPLWP